MDATATAAQALANKVEAHYIIRTDSGMFATDPQVYQDPCGWVDAYCNTHGCFYGPDYITVRRAAARVLASYNR